jgi:hypothetical protein
MQMEQDMKVSGLLTLKYDRVEEYKYGLTVPDMRVTLSRVYVRAMDD